MRKTMLTIGVFVGSVFAGGALAQKQPAFNDALLDHLSGKWLLEGTIADKRTTHDVEAQWVLGHHYLRIHEVSREKTAQGNASYEATVFVGWDPALAQYAIVWLDTYGGIAPISFGNAKRNGNQIPFLFTDKNGSFHNTFTYMPDTDSWTWRMDNEEKGKLDPFARVSLTRQNGK